MEKEIKQIKALLGKLACDFNLRVCSPKNFYGVKPPSVNDVDEREDTL